MPVSSGSSTGKGGQGQEGRLVTELIEALRAMRPGPGEVTTFQQAIIEEYAELKRSLRGPDTVSPGPVIAHVKPLQGCPGDTVEIHGERLLDTTLVRIGAGRIQAFERRREACLTVKVPDNATTGEVTVFTPLGVAASMDKFEVTHASKGTT